MVPEFFKYISLTIKNPLLQKASSEALCDLLNDQPEFVESKIDDFIQLFNQMSDDTNLILGLAKALR